MLRTVGTMMKFGTQQQIWNAMSHMIQIIIIIILNSRWRTAAMLENTRNAITRLSMERFGRHLDGRISSCSRHVRHDAVVMGMAVAQQPHIERQLWAFGVSGD